MNHTERPFHIAGGRFLARAERAEELDHEEIAAAASKDNKEAVIYFDVNPSLPVKDQDKIRGVLSKFKHLFTDEEGGSNWGLKVPMKYHVDLKPDTVPFYESSERKSKEENNHLKEVNDRWLKAGIISHSNSPWGARVVIPKKKMGLQGNA